MTSQDSAVVRILLHTSTLISRLGHTLMFNHCQIPPPAQGVHLYKEYTFHVGEKIKYSNTVGVVLSLLNQSEPPSASTAGGANPLVYKISRRLSCGAKESYASCCALTSAGWAGTPHPREASAIGQGKRRLTVTMEMCSRGKAAAETSTTNPLEHEQSASSRCDGIPLAKSLSWWEGSEGYRQSGHT